MKNKKANRTEPTLDDLARSFERNKVTLVELEEFINSVDTPEFALKKHTQPQKKEAFFKRNTTGKWGDLIPVETGATAIQTEAATSTSGATSSATNGKRSKRACKTNKEYLGFCDDPSNKELLERLSDEENEYVYDYFPLMVRPLPAGMLKLSSQSKIKYKCISINL